MHVLFCLQLFKGNTDDDTLVTHMMDCPFIARFLRLHPQDWINHVALRFDAIGCQAITGTVYHCFVTFTTAKLCKKRVHEIGNNNRKTSTCFMVYVNIPISVHT